MTASVSAAERITELEASIDELRASLVDIARTGEISPGTRSEQGGLALVVFSGDLDKQLGAFILANSAAAAGQPVTMYFSFWGTTALKVRTRFRGKGLLQAGFATMLPRGAATLRLSRMNMFGLGPVLMRALMKQKNVASLPSLIEAARALGVRMIVCQMSMELLGLEVDEIQEGVEFGGAATCVQSALKSSSSMFI